MTGAPITVPCASSSGPRLRILLRCTYLVTEKMTGWERAVEPEPKPESEPDSGTQPQPCWADTRAMNEFEHERLDVGLGLGLGLDLSQPQPIRTFVTRLLVKDSSVWRSTSIASA
jgi:hypothetical protein